MRQDNLPYKIVKKVWGSDKDDQSITCTVVLAVGDKFFQHEIETFVFDQSSAEKYMETYPIGKIVTYIVEVLCEESKSKRKRMFKFGHIQEVESS